MLELTQNRILESINNFKERCYDVPLDAENLDAVVENDLVFHYNKDEESKETVIPNSSAKSQFLTKIKVPVNFFERCPKDLKQLILDYFNTERDYLLRCVRDEKEGDYCRAVLSSIFTLNYDNHLVFPVLMEVLKEHDVSLRSFTNDGTITRMEVLMDDARVDYNWSTAIPGLMVTNSETGHSSLWIEPILVVNSSYLFASRRNAYKDYRKFRQIHKGEGLKLEEISETIKEALKAAQIGAIQYFEESKKTVSPKQAIDFATSIDALPKRFVAILEKNWQDIKELEKGKLACEILEAAANLPILSKITVEQAVGQWYGIFDNYTSRFDKIQEQIRINKGENIANA